MKRLILVAGTMGIGKTAVCRELQKLLPKNVFLDGDWCWDMRPFTVTGETKAMVVGNICHMLNSFLACSEYENVIFCWVMHEQAIIDDILSRLDLRGAQLRVFALTASAKSLTERLESDVAAGLRERDVIARSVGRLALYDRLDAQKIEVSSISAAQAAGVIAGAVM